MTAVQDIRELDSLIGLDADFVTLGTSTKGLEEHPTAIIKARC